MAIDLLGRSSTDDDSPVCSEADVEGYITLEMKTGECLASMMEEGEIRHMGDDLWFLGTGATGHFTYDLDYLRTMLSAVGCSVVRVVTLFL